MPNRPLYLVATNDNANGVDEREHRAASRAERDAVSDVSFIFEIASRFSHASADRAFIEHGLYFSAWSTAGPSTGTVRVSAYGSDGSTAGPSPGQVRVSACGSGGSTLARPLNVSKCHLAGLAAGRQLVRPLDGSECQLAGLAGRQLARPLEWSKRQLSGLAVDKSPDQRTGQSARLRV